MITFRIFLTLAFLAGANFLLQAQDKPGSAKATATEADFEPIKQRLQPADFLDSVGQQTKTLWRRLYREAPPPPSTDRLRVAFTLGGIIADCYLTLQASDAQKFKDTNQDVHTYVKVLGMGEKLSPALLSERKMAETEDWMNTRRQVGDIQVQIEKLLVSQKDEDLAVLVDLGMWMRLFEITTSVFQNNPELNNRTLCIGSKALLDDLKARYDKMSEATRKNEGVTHLGSTLDLLQRHWESAGAHPEQDIVDLTHEKVAFLMGRLTLMR